MRIIIAALVLSIAACGQTTQAPAPETPAPATDAAAPEAPAADLGPYAGEWDSDQFSRFNHTLRAAAPGRRTVTLEARTGGGTETVAVYPADANGERAGGRLLFVVATTGGNRETAELDIPEAGLPVVVVVENASGRQASGSYSLSVTP
ncbi:MAG TPA: hypothetical protein VEA80_14595 [Vitreimonas sp.]|uniref:hypothetical protein n=1 Tax=Vitreimonas sp. TaxID=3069702 RepID=UPI002D5EAA67|nr:hypothetical protein [Vitreimonas sp.]HYD88700.1 hypothetical protein [Vitreimonas sp.]